MKSHTRRVAYLDSGFRRRAISFGLKLGSLFLSPASRLASLFGGAIVLPATPISALLETYKYSSYEKYVQIQTRTNKKKLSRVFASPLNISVICDEIMARTGKERPVTGLCHGTRNGLEQRMFIDALPAASQILGTEISDTATSFPFTVQWDFHNRNEDWVGKFDFVYTNSHDHAYDLRAALNVWLECLNPEGVLVIEHDVSHGWKTPSDPTGIVLELLPYLLVNWLNDTPFSLIKIVDLPHSPYVSNKRKAFLISSAKA